MYTFKKMFPDGIERKLTLVEFIAQVADDSHVSIVSQRKGVMITGSKTYCIDHLDKIHYGDCVQGAEDIGCETIVHLR